MIVDHIAIKVKNIDEMQQWYETHLNAVVETRTDSYVRLRMDNTVIALIDARQYRYDHVGILVEKWENLPTKGVRTTHRDGTLGVYCFDPEGNVIEYIWYPDKTEVTVADANKRKSARRGIFQKIYDWGSSLLG
tara:strand:- start:1482 stop:1883 length:402 start_codon:yes stop_codon:yes gene_type:complete